VSLAIGAVTVAALAASAPAPVSAVPNVLDLCRSVEADYANLGDGIRVNCVVIRAAVPVGVQTGYIVVSPAAEPSLPMTLSPGLVQVPVPTALATDGRPGCVTGPGRPVVATTMPTLSVTFAGVPLALPVQATFEYEPLRRSEGVVTASGWATAAALPATLDISPGEFRPGESYRWRVRGTPDHAIVPGWSPWCEFTVAADVPDLRGVEADIDAVLALELYPDRRYAVTLTARQWRTVLEAVDVEGDAARAMAVRITVTGAEPGELDPDRADALRRWERIVAAVRKQLRDGAPARRVAVTLTGGQWASVAAELASWANLADEVAAEATEPDIPPDGSAYWAVLDAVSARLGGPSRPGLSYRR
jgi:hypothetical protein